MGEVKGTIRELILCMIAFILLICIAGSFFVDNKLSFLLGLLYGSISSCIFLFHMYYTLNVSLEMEPEAAEKREKGMAVLRMIIVGVVLAIGFLLPDVFHIIGILFGIFSLKIAAYLQPILHNYILKNREGR